MSGIDRAIPGRSVLKRCVIGNPLGHLNALGRNHRRLARGARQTEVFATFKTRTTKQRGQLQIAYCLERACHKRVTRQVFVAVVGTITARVVTVTIRSAECRKRGPVNQLLPLTRLV